MRRIFIISLIIMVSVLVVFAGETWNGRTGAQIMKMNPAIRSLGLGGGYISGIGGVESLTLNPAGLTHVERRMAAVGDTELVEGIRILYGGYAQKYGIFYFGAEIKALYDTFDIVDELGAAAGSLSVYSLAPSFGVGMKVSPTFSFGGSATVLLEDYGDVTQFMWALNGGIQMSFFHDVIRFGGAVRNVALSQLSYYDGSEMPMPMMGNAGLSYVFKDVELRDKIIITADIEIPYDRSWIISGGAEYSLADWVKLRAAYRLNDDYDMIDNISFGLELKETVKKVTGALQYAYVGYGDVIGTHRVSYAMYW